MNRRKKTPPDRILLAIVAVIVVMGILMVYSASSFRGAEKYNDSAQFLKNHVIRVAMGVLLLLVSFRIDYHKYRGATPLLLLMFFVLLIAVLFRPEFQGSRRSFIIMGKQFQPSEFMKLVLIFYLAAVFGKDKDIKKMPVNTLMAHFFIVLMLVALVFIEPDLGSALIMFFIGVSMFYLAGIPSKHLAKMGMFLVPLVSFSLLVFGYQRQRLMDFWSSVFGSGDMSYQVKQSIIGFAHGGFTGVGYGAGKQKLYFLPEPFSDFILTSYGEEFGFIGLIFLFALFGIVLWRGIRIALQAPDRYGFLLAGGITAMIMINGLMNAGVAVNLIPTTGLPFPFMSYGGSSLFVNLMAVGILLNISTKRAMGFKKFTAMRSKSTRWMEE